MITRTRRMRRKALLFVPALALALGLAGCGGGEDDDDNGGGDDDFAAAQALDG